GAVAFVALLAVTRAHVLLRAPPGGVIVPHTPVLQPPHFFGATPLGGHVPVLVLTHGHPGGPPFVPGGVFPHGRGPNCTDGEGGGKGPGGEFQPPRYPGKSSEGGGSARNGNGGALPGFATGVGVPGQPTFQLVPVFNVHGGPPLLHPVPVYPKGKGGKKKAEGDAKGEGRYYVGYVVPSAHGPAGVPFHTGFLG
ncbi:unnamed protein product, partial [Ixodes hexagonus]